MKQTSTNKEKIFQLLHILIPILITQVAMFSMNFFDTTMSGHYRAIDLAGVAIGSSLWVPVFTGLSGILLAITPLVSHLVGAKSEAKVANQVTQGVYLAAIIALFVIIIGGIVLNPILNRMGLESEVKRVAHDYLVALSFGMIPLFIYQVLRSFIDALGKTRITMLISLTALPINILFNYLLIFGKFGFPMLGGVGSGYATAITYWVITIITVLLLVTQSTFKKYQLFGRFYSISFQSCQEILKIGVPIGLAIFFETSIFAAVTLFMSGYDTATIASHQAALNFASFLYMIPLSISMALTIVVGFEVGAKRYSHAAKYSWIGVAMAVVMAFICAFILLVFRHAIAGIYTSEYEVLELTAHFLLYALFFQLSDAIQAPIQGALRGYKDVNITFVMSLISYWIIGLPLGYILANYTDWGAFGYWIGLISGLAFGAIFLSCRLLFIQKRRYSRQSN